MLSRSSVTSLFEVAGLLLLAVAAGFEVARFTVAGGVGTGGAVLILESALLTRMVAPRKPKPREDDTA